MAEQARPRLYTDILRDHLKAYRQMILLSGPRQVGKTTVAKGLATDYLSWDDDSVRATVLAGQGEVAHRFGLDRLTEHPRVVAFDELHKFPRWKQFLKGFFDVYGDQTKILVTGSARLDIYKRGGDSLMGRYFPYRMHPLSVAELLDQTDPGERLIRPARDLAETEWRSLLAFGGFPDPFVRRDVRFSTRWNRLRREQLVHDDIRSLTQVADLDQMDALAALLVNRSAEQLVYRSLANEIRVDEKTVKQWVTVLKRFYFGFEVRPYARNIANAIRKTPKWFLRDWAQIADPGKRFETLVACHLLKAVDGWTDLGYGTFALWYLRDKSKREADFLVTRDQAPWFIVEAKVGDTRLSPSLAFFQRATGAKHAFQVVQNLDFTDADCFAQTVPVVVPARTLLSQLL